ncbi:hypothetical protein ACFFRR_002970 [Megaselia abdita]
MTAVSEFVITVEEDIFLLVNYKKKTNYIKVCFKFNDEYHNVLVKEAISAAFGKLDTESCDFFWDGALISENDLIPLIKAKKSCGHFKLTVKDRFGHQEHDDSDSNFEEEPVCKKAKGVLSVVKFKNFVNTDVASKMLLEGDPTEPSVRRILIDCAVKYLFQECGTLPTMNERESLANIVCEVYKALKPEEELVLKWILEKIKNVRSKIAGTGSRKRRRSSDGMNLHIEKQMDFLESCVNIEDIPKIENALKDTLKYRINKYSNSDFSVFNTYKFFSKSLDLILYEFKLRVLSVDDNILQTFESFLDAACNVYKTETKQCLPEEDCLTGIRKLLTICHYTKTPNGPKNPSYTIQEMMKEFITYSTMDEDKKPEFKEHPIIVAQGSSKKAIWKYFIQIGDVLLELPHQTKCIRAVDYLLRCYYVFNIEFPKIISVFFNFIMVNIYDISIKSKYDPKKAKIEDLHSRSRDFLKKVQKYL